MKTLFLIWGGFSLFCWAFDAPTLPLRVQLGPFAESIVLSGTIEPVRSHAVKVKWFSTIQKLFVNVGDKVHAGAPLAQVEVRYLEYRRDYYKSREKFLLGHIEQSRVDEKYVANRQKRMRELASKDLVSKADEEKFSLKALDAKLQRVRLEGELKSIRRYQAETEQQINEANYFSPMDGTVTELVVNPKQLMGSFLVMPDAILARIDQGTKYLVKAQGLDIQIVQLHAGQPATVWIEGFEKSLPGELGSIVRANQDNVFEVTVLFEREGKILNRGLAARVEVSLPSANPVLSVPWNALRSDGGRHFVSVADPNQGYIDREVKLGRRSAHRAEIISGLKEGEVIESVLW
ncbi:MAG: efflux RND transporter periplasmic adaptor subunit [Deltaproteobacteria bacterium]|nr:efflux RND transporter periplasmic adaptor subunit [Deltaproteobacteria bacterium]